jgi:hypothetical protein
MYGLMYYVCVEFTKLCAYPPYFPFIDAGLSDTDGGKAWRYTLA